MIFIVKKVISLLLFPAGMVTSLWLLGSLVWGVRRHSPWGPRILWLAGFMLFVFSWPPVGWLLLNSLEDQNPIYARPSELLQQGVSNIVVLSAGFSPGPGMPWDKLNAPSIKRTLEGVRLWKRMPGSRLILMGGDFYSANENCAISMGQLALRMGVPQESMKLETDSWDTADQAASMVEELKQHPFALVTSASHMPRALWLFERQGLSPIPAPADFHTLDWRFSHTSVLPTVNGLVQSQRAIYEYLAMAYLWAMENVR